MVRSVVLRSGLVVLLALSLSRPGAAQTFPFTSGPIPLCDTSTFTANVSGIGILSDPWNPWWSYTLQGVTINITSDHPQTLQIFLTSPGGTTLTLAEFLGAGGQNYTNTTFGYMGYPSITTGTAPFTGIWTAQGGGLNVFDGQNADGTWTITVIDTACANGGVGPGGTWTPGWFDGNGGGSGGFSFAFTGPPPCWGGIPSGYDYICPGETFDLAEYYGVMWSGYTYTFTDWTTGSPVPDPSAVGPGYYNVDAYDPWQGCQYWGSFEVYESIQIALGPDQVVDHCSGDGPVNLQALFNLTGVTYSYWSLNGTAIAPSTATTAMAPGVYQMIGENYGGCNDTAVVTLNILPGPALDPDQTINVCPGTSVDLTTLYTTGANATAWTQSGVPVPDPTAVTSMGVFTLTVTDMAGCTATANVTLDPIASSSIGPDQSLDVCSNTSTDLTGLYGTAGLTASWSFMGAPVADPTSVSAAGTYQLVASNGSGCADTALVFVNVLAAPLLGADATASVCVGNTADLTTLFSTAGLSTTWTVADPTAVATPGVYTLIATSVSGCADTANVDLAEYPSPVLGPDQALTECDGTIVNLTSLYATGTDATAWTQNGVVVANPTAVTTAGTYVLTVTNGTGCTAAAAVTLTMEAAPDLGADASVDVCSNALVDLTPLYNATGLATSWTVMGAAVTDPTSVGSGIYQLVVSNGAGCNDTALVSVNAITSPSLGPDASAAACAGSSVDLNTYFITSGLSTMWTSSGAVVPDPSAVSAAGTYTLIATSPAGCSDTVQVVLAVSPNPLLGPDASVTECDGAVIDLTALYATGSDATVWTTNGVPVGDPAAVTNGGIYTLTATNAAGCSATALVTVVFDPAPALGADQLASICDGATFDLTSAYSTDGLIPAWTLGGVPVADPFAVAATGNYQLVVLNNTGCSDTATVALAVNPNPDLGADQVFSLCPWQTVDLSTAFPTAGMTASYTLNSQPVIDPTLVSDTGAYMITVIDANGCADEAIASVMAMECMCVADFVAAAHCTQDPVQFTLLADSMVISAHWDFGGAADMSTDIDPRMIFSAEGEVVVTLQATLTCGTVTVQQTIKMQDCSDSCSVWVPSAFTPDSDNRNDTWSWNGECEPEDFSMEIFNRFGELIFASRDPMASWDGTYRGTVSPDGVYVYRVGYRLPYQKRKEVMGSITLVR